MRRRTVLEQEKSRLRRKKAKKLIKVLLYAMAALIIITAYAIGSEMEYQSCIVAQVCP